jgi:acyl-CoA thioesterase-1
MGQFMRVLVTGLLALTIILAQVNSAFSYNTADEPIRLLVLGDSLTAGYGLPAEQSFPALLSTALQQSGVDAEVINSGVSGDTTAGGLARLDWSLAENPDLVIVELGANDALRGLDVTTSFENLDAILVKLKQKDARVILSGMRAPPSMGADYTDQFDRIYSELAAKHNVALYPFFLEGVALEPSLNQSDGIHPNAAGVAVIVQNLLPLVLSEIATIDQP